MALAVWTSVSFPSVSWSTHGIPVLNTRWMRLTSRVATRARGLLVVVTLFDYQTPIHAGEIGIDASGGVGRQVERPFDAGQDPVHHARLTVRKRLRRALQRQAHRRVPEHDNRHHLEGAQIARAMENLLQHGEAAQCAGLSTAGAGDHSAIVEREPYPTEMQRPLLQPHAVGVVGHGRRPIGEDACDTDILRQHVQKFERGGVAVGHCFD